MKQELVGVKGDARSYYKRTSAGRIMTAFFIFVTLTRMQTNLSTITLLRAQKWRGFIGGSTRCRLRDKVVISFEEMRDILQYELQVGGFGTVRGTAVRLRCP